MRCFVSSRRALLLSACLSLAALPALAQDAAPPEDEEDGSDAVIVTATRITQGGAQDVKHFRSIALDELGEAGLPQAAGFTVEGLLSEHDLVLPAKKACTQLFCVATHAKPSARAPGEHFIGIGFDSGIDAEAYKAEPISLIALVDRSGSMSGEPMARVKEGLHAVIDRLGEGDRMGIVIYGTTSLIHQPVIEVAGNKAALHRAVDAIEINGSTSMEGGMRLGYAAALAERENSRGKTRMMLFTDENPNTDNTSPEGFMAQAIEGSRNGVGLTTIGVGAHFDGALATQVSSVRGGNLFFVPREGSASELFAKEFGNMVSEVAQDLVISIDPADGVKVGAIYGVPGELIADAGNGTVTVTIGSAFLSSNGGGIFATLEGDPAGGALADISVSYTAATTQKRESDTDRVAVSDEGVPANLVKAEVLVDQYVTTRAALAQYHEKRDAKGAATMLAALSDRIASSGVAGLDGEVELVAGLQAKASRLAGLGGRTLPFELFGDWKVVRHKGVTDVARGDLIAITDDGEFITERTRGPAKGDEIYQSYAVNERQLHIEGTDLVFNYRIRGNRLFLQNALDGVEIVMERDTTT
ncbi:VWA domain-containing protein [Porphyrobacter sp. YT40]|uniref:vWA domain-containing protein n=1 Tax=Porphyrobacter sp. YT40 TaxID=2547601 RepID=UPI001142ABC7|nr:VWA domain-containing protein [Porphyrobacter sp. YT40]QDH32872.1 VWA domain-containing protein [Porphyrobacter sp. YT40]